MGGYSSSGDPMWQNSCSSGPLGESSSLRETPKNHTDKRQDLNAGTTPRQGDEDLLMTIFTSLFREDTSLASQFGLPLHHSVDKAEL